MNILIVKMINGEEVVADVEYSIDETTLHLKNPAALGFQRRAEGEEPQLMMGPIMMYSVRGEGTLSVDSRNILYTYEPADNVINAYNGLFGSGIQIASAADLPNNVSPISK